MLDSSCGNRRIVIGKRGQCPDCGQAYERRTYEGRLTAWTPVCGCLDKRIAAERKRLCEDAVRRIRQDRIAELLEQARLGPRFAEATFEGYHDRPGTRRAYLEARALVEHWPERSKRGEGLLLIGPWGTSKSFLAAAIVNALVKRGMSAVFQSVPDLLRRFRATYDPSSAVSESAILDALAEADLLVLDDLGAERWTEWTESQLYQVIDARYRWRRPLVVTTNLQLGGEIENTIGYRTMDRLVEMCRMIETSGPSLRVMQAEARKRQEQASGEGLKANEA
ncbi:MAG: ATP-binding protein [Bacteroidota bacterium]